MAIRKVEIETGTVSTLAGDPGIIGTADTATGVKATFTQIGGITTDGTDLYVTNGVPANIIRRIDKSNGTVTTIAGTRDLSGSSDVSPVSFFGPSGITTDGTKLYLSDSANHTIRMIQ